MNNLECKNCSKLLSKMGVCLKCSEYCVSCCENYGCDSDDGYDSDGMCRDCGDGEVGHDDDCACCSCDVCDDDYFNGV